MPPLTPGLLSVRDLFSKLQRDATLLNQEVTSDRFFNFVVTGYSMIDWVQNDESIPPTARETQVIKALRDDPWLSICGALAIASKHFRLDERQGRAITKSASSERGFGKGRFGKGSYGVGEESIVIVELNNGRTHQCLELVEGVLSTWKTFFAQHGIEPSGT
jgi:hypothetical protein